MKLMRDKASALEATDQQADVPGASIKSMNPIYDSMLTKLSMLKPVSLDIVDESAKHAGHAGLEGMQTSETHFSVKIVAACFQGLTLVQRHKMVYTLLASEMSGGVHALSLSTKTPEEERPLD